MMNRNVLESMEVDGIASEYSVTIYADEGPCSSIVTQPMFELKDDLETHDDEDCLYCNS